MKTLNFLMTSSYHTSRKINTFTQNLFFLTHEFLEKKDSKLSTELPNYHKHDESIK